MRDRSEPHDARFRAFSFVDRIGELAVGERARGRFAIPAGLPAFPACLVAEAVGQLAAWAAMAHVDFRRRPVAGLAGEVRFLGAVKPGEALELEVALESCDDEAVAYRGSAWVKDAKVLELNHCVGPMLPLADFDEPDAMRARLELLRDAGAPGGEFGGLPPPELGVIDRRPGERIRAALRVPAAAAFFADHFPRRAVFPGTLLLDSQLRLAADLVAGELPRASPPPVPARVTDVKIRSFIPPGQLVELEAEFVRPPSTEPCAVALTARVNGRSISSGRVEFGSGGLA